MGYTHYFPQIKAITPAQWNAICDDIEKLCEKAYSLGIALSMSGEGEDDLCYVEKFPIESPDATLLEDHTVNLVQSTDLMLIENNPPVAYFNGFGDDAHETFYLTYNDYTFNFCKTRSKPYDDVVVACLFSMMYHALDAYNISSDGECKESFMAGALLWKETFPDRVFNTLSKDLLCIEAQD